MALSQHFQISGSLKNIFDKDKVQSELDLQRTISQDFNKNIQAAHTEINQHLDTLKANKEAAEKAAVEALAKGDRATAERKTQEAITAAEKAEKWQRGKVILNMIATGLAAPTQSGAGIAAATASPAISYEIGQYFKGLAQENQRTGKTQEAELTTRQETAHILAHAILGAAVSAAGGNDALAGALSAGGAEAAAPVISGWLYGEKDGSKLTAEQKETVVAITGLLGTTAGAVTGSTAVNAVQGSLNAQSAVGNNYAVLNNPTVRGVGIGGIRTVGVPLMVGIYCLADSNCSDAGNAVIETFNQEAESVRQALNMSSSDNQIENNNETTNSLVGHVSQAATGSPQIEPPDEKQSKNKVMPATKSSISLCCYTDLDDFFSLDYV